MQSEKPGRMGSGPTLSHGLGSRSSATKFFQRARHEPHLSAGWYIGGIERCVLSI